MSTEKTIVIGIIIVICSLMYSILYYNLELQKVFKEGVYEECYVGFDSRNTKTIIVKDCEKTLKEYKAIQENKTFN